MEFAFPASLSVDGSGTRLPDNSYAPFFEQTPIGSHWSSERVTPLGQIAQDPTYLASITARATLNEKRVIQAARSDQAVTGVYLLARRNKGWTLETRGDTRNPPPRPTLHTWPESRSANKAK